MRYSLQEMSVTKSQPVSFICTDAPHSLTFLNHQASLLPNSSFSNSFSSRQPLQLSFTHSVAEVHLWNTCYTPGPVLGTEDKAVNRTDKNPFPQEPYSEGDSK